MTQEVNAKVLIDIPLFAAWEKLKDISLAHNYVPGIVKTEIVSEQLQGIGDIEKKYRKLVLLKLKPHELGRLSFSFEKINILYDEGHTIIYWTARGGSSGIDQTEITQKQIIKWGAKNHGIKLGKPSYDMFICDKAVNSHDFFKD